MGHVLTIRSDQDSLFKPGVLSDQPLLMAVLLVLGLQPATVYIPFLPQGIFKTQPLSVWEQVLWLAMSSVVFWAVETDVGETEYFIRRREMD